MRALQWQVELSPFRVRSTEESIHSPGLGTDPYCPGLGVCETSGCPFVETVTDPYNPSGTQGTAVGPRLCCAARQAAAPSLRR